MSENSSSLKDLRAEHEMDEWIRSAAASVGYEHGFGVHGCDLSRSTGGWPT